MGAQPGFRSRAHVFDAAREFADAPMPFLTILLAALLPLGTPGAEPGAEGEVLRQTDSKTISERNQRRLSDRAPGWVGLAEALEPSIARQVRIERRVILRISPQPSPVRRDMFADIPSRAAEPRLVEHSMNSCIPTGGIVGVADRGSRLIIFMRDRSLISATLEKTCSPRDFYLGFYLERSDDGQLCIDRDRLLSRSGAKCRVTAMRRLEPVGDDR